MQLGSNKIRLLAEETQSRIFRFCFFTDMFLVVHKHLFMQIFFIVQ